MTKIKVFRKDGHIVALEVKGHSGPGMEACWPGPSPEFYRTRTCSAFLFQNIDSEALS